MVLDETMAHACISAGRNAFTADMHVRFRRPLPVNSAVRITARTQDAGGRVIRATGEVVADDGTVVAQAEGRYMASPRAADGSG